MTARVNTPLTGKTESEDKPVMPAFSNPEFVLGNTGGRSMVT